MAQERGDGEFFEDLSVLKQRLDAIEFKITSFDEMENTIFDFFSKFEEKVNQIAESKIKGLGNSAEKKQVDDSRLKNIEETLDLLSKDVADVSRRARDIVSKAVSKSGKTIDIESLISEKFDELEEKLHEKLEEFANGAKEGSPKDLGKVGDVVNKKINNLEMQFDEFQKTCAPHEYVAMLETEFRNKFNKVNDKFDELVKLIPADKASIVNTQKDLDEFRKEINDFRINELMPSKQAVTDVELDLSRLKDQIKTIRETELMPLELGKTKGKSAGDTGNINIDAFNKQVQWLKNELEKVDTLQDELVNLRQIVVSKPSDSSLKKDLLLLQDELLKLKENVPVQGDTALINDFSALQEELNKIKIDMKKPGKDESANVRKDFGLLQEEFAKVREELSSISDSKDAEKINEIEKSMNGMKDDLKKFSVQMSDFKSSAAEKQIDALQDKIDRLENNFSQFKSYTVEQVGKISKWIEFIDRCMK